MKREIAVLLALIIFTVGCTGCYDSRMGLSVDTIRNYEDITAEETVRMFYYLWNRRDYKELLDLIKKDSDFYYTMQDEQKIAEGDDSLRKNIQKIEIISIKKESRDQDGVVTYYVIWKGRSGRDETYFDLKRINNRWIITDSTLYV